MDNVLDEGGRRPPLPGNDDNCRGGSETRPTNNDQPSFYARGFSHTELEDLRRLQGSGVTEEIILLRVIIRRAFEYALERDDVKEALAFVNAIGNACTRLTHMVTAQKKLAEAPSEVAGAITQALEEVIRELGVTA